MTDVTNEQRAKCEAALLDRWLCPGEHLATDQPYWTVSYPITDSDECGGGEHLPATPVDTADGREAWCELLMIAARPSEPRAENAKWIAVPMGVAIGIVVEAPSRNDAITAAIDAYVLRWWEEQDER